MIDYTIIIPVYCNEDSLDLLYEKINNDVIDKNKNLKGQICFCDDGSTDSSYKNLVSLNQKYSNVKVIKLSRNFGQAAGIYAGLSVMESKSYIIMSADLQDPVELINQFIDVHFNSDYQIIAGVRKSRKDSLLSIFLSKISFWILKKLSFKNFPSNGFDFVLISKKVRDLMLKINPSDPFWPGDILWAGFKVKFIPYDRLERFFGKSKYTLSKKITTFLDGIIGFSYFPIRFMSFIGFLVFLIGIVYASYILLSKLYGLGNIEYGWAPIMIIILILGGLQMLFLGIMGEYIWRTLSQARNRPKYVIEDILD
jgi:polyisoprenyl-phosphate glycosyltransferase